MQQREGQGGVGSRCQLQVQVRVGRCAGAEWVNDNLRRRRGQEPVLELMRPRDRRIGTPNHDARSVSGRARIEPCHRRPVHVVEREMTSLVADRVGVDLRGAEPGEEPQREAVGENRAGPGVVGVHDRGRILARDLRKSGGDLRESGIPGDRLELSGSLGRSPPQRSRQSGIRIQEDTVVANRALAAQLAAADPMVRIAAHMPDRAVLTHSHQNAAGVIAVTWTYRANQTLGHARLDPISEALSRTTARTHSAPKPCTCDRGRQRGRPRGSPVWS